MYSAFRQLAQQSGESGSDEDRDLGTAELGRDDGWLLQPGLRSEDFSERLAAGKESCCGEQGFTRRSLSRRLNNMKIAPRALIVFPIILAVLCAFSAAQSVTSQKKHLLVIGEEKGYRHESVSHAMATVERLGRENGLWETTLRTDTEVLTKKKLEYNAKNLNDFDAVLFFTGGSLEMDAQQKADLLSFVHDEGKGFVGVHSATITFTDWPEYGEMIGGY